MEKYLPLALGIIAGLAFGSWPNIPSSSPARIPIAALTLSVAIGLLCVATIQFFTTKITLAEMQATFTTSTVKYVLGVMIINSIGYLAYAPLVIMSKELNTNTFIIVALVMTPIATYLYGIVFQNEIISLKNTLAMLFIIGGIILLKVE